MPKTKWDGAEDPTINNYFKIDSRQNTRFIIGINVIIVN